MKICIIGAGAIGGLLGARLAQAGHELSLVARGAPLACDWPMRYSSGGFPVVSVPV